MGNRSACVLIAMVSLATLAAGCGSDNAAPKDDSAAAEAKVANFSCPAPAVTAGADAKGPLDGKELQVVATVAPITSIVANIAGDKAQVHGVIPEGEDSHTYEPKPSVAELASSADIVFVNGLKLEDPTEEIAAQNIRKGAEIVELGTLTISPDEYIYDFSFPKDGGKPNPHLWTNPPMAKCYAAIAAAAMAKADPANASYYEGNATAYGAKIDQLDQLMKDATAGMPAGNRELLTYHDAYAYFAAHYGWKVIGAIQVSNFEDPTPKEVTALIGQIEEEKVPAIFGSEVFPSPVLAQLSKETGVKYVDQLRDDDLPGGPGDPDHSYLGLMKFDFVTMVSNLGGDASKLQGFDPSDVVTDQADYPQ
jgi:ABC-type Zn uptake system ZnuABC Zn-binding protein ZnuA